MLDLWSQRGNIFIHTLPHALFEPKDSFSSLMNYINSKLFAQLQQFCDSVMSCFIITCILM